MIRIEDTHIGNVARAVYSARNAMNSWDKSDSDRNSGTLGAADLALAKKLSRAGTDHRKFMRMIAVYCDIVAPRYWWEQFATYRVGVTMNSCSTMHKIHAKEFTLNDFSHEHLRVAGRNVLLQTIEALNAEREAFIGHLHGDKQCWHSMIQLLPQSYNQRRTVMLNYEVLSNIYPARRNHKLDEWHTFCEWIETLPYSEIITGKDGSDER